MRRRAQPATRRSRTQWQRVHAFVRCGFGCEIHAPGWALFGAYRADGRRFIVCVEHAKQYYSLEPPAPVYSCQRSQDDVKARQVGGDA